MAYRIEGTCFENCDCGVACPCGAMSDGGWRVGMLFDAGTSEEQRQALTRVFSGELGGPPSSSRR